MKTPTGKEWVTRRQLLGMGITRLADALRTATGSQPAAGSHGTLPADLEEVVREVDRVIDRVRHQAHPSPDALEALEVEILRRQTRYEARGREHPDAVQADVGLIGSGPPLSDDQHLLAAHLDLPTPQQVEDWAIHSDHADGVIAESEGAPSSPWGDQLSDGPSAPETTL